MKITIDGGERKINLKQFRLLKKVIVSLAKNLNIPEDDFLVTHWHIDGSEENFIQNPVDFSFPIRGTSSKR